jgi:hypothetical protein
MNVFLAFAFHDVDRPLERAIERILDSHFAAKVTGENLAGAPLTAGVQQRIESCDALVALMTRREKIKGGAKWRTHQWVTDEIAHARAKGLLAIALVEDGVELGGMFQANEYIPLDRKNLSEAWLRVGETLAEWRRKLGRKVKIQLQPDDVARLLDPDDKNIVIEYTLASGGSNTVWKQIRPVEEQGGVFVYVDGVHDHHLIQLRVLNGTKKWRSVATNQWMPVELKLTNTL